MQPEKEYIKQLNEMATVGKCNGIRVITNSLDHGLPHVHYGNIKIYLPEELPSTLEDMKSFVDKSFQNKISKFLNWLGQKSLLMSKATNLEMAWVLWNAEHPEEQERN